jgi:hypothetical protein
LITIQLTKLETALDQVRKAYPKVNAADAALVAAALSLAGRHAVAIYDGVEYTWPEENEKLFRAMIPEIQQVQTTVEPTKKAKAAATEDEPVTLTVGLAPNYAAGEKKLGDRNELKTLMSDILQEGVEFVYNPTDIGWQWALDRANWTTYLGEELLRRVKVKTSFVQGAVGVEMGTTTKKRATKKAAAAEVETVEA